MRDQLREAARALLYEMGPYGQQESGDLDRAIATLRAALDAPQDSFDPDFNCPTHFAGGDPTCPSCVAKQPQPLLPIPDAPQGGAVHPCAKCGVMRTEAEGGTTFTVCDECWDAKHGAPQGGGEAVAYCAATGAPDRTRTGIALGTAVHAYSAAQEPPRAKPAEGGEGVR